MDFLWVRGSSMLLLDPHFDLLPHVSLFHSCTIGFLQKSNLARSAENPNRDWACLINRFWRGSWTAFSKVSMNLQVGMVSFLPFHATLNGQFFITISNYWAAHFQLLLGWDQGFSAWPCSKNPVILCSDYIICLQNHKTCHLKNTRRGNAKVSLGSCRKNRVKEKQ